MWQTYHSVTTTQQALELLAAHAGKGRIVAGGTDMMLELERGLRPEVDTLIDISRIPGLTEITLDEDDVIHLGPLVTHNHCVASPLIRRRAAPLAEAAWEVGSPQIRNRGTVAGNLITASPANDTITPLMALDARLTLASISGERQVPLRAFYTGVRRTVMRPDEMLVDIAFPALRPNQRGVFLKLGLRRAQAIALVNAALVLTLDGNVIQQAAITLGAVAPTIVHARKAEAYLTGHPLTAEHIQQAARLAQEAATPIDDVRASAAYRREMVRVLVTRGLEILAGERAHQRVPDEAVLLWGTDVSWERGTLQTPARHPAPIETRINGQAYSFEAGYAQSLLDLLREQAGLTGPKEGCAEGECGACTVFLDGVAVMACLVPAPRAHGAEIVSVEGLAQDEALHAVQQAFVEHGAVQCGYCTPGFVMSAAKLLEEKANPSEDEIRQAFTGNLCRCTGYYKIVQAVEDAVRRKV
ncbi:MAG: hypothetical protein Fur0018_27650 [Anaerolineales bacterium]